MSEINANELLKKYQESQGLLEEENIDQTDQQTNQPQEPNIQTSFNEDALVKKFKEAQVDTPSRTVWKTIQDYSGAGVRTAWSQSSQAMSSLLLEDEFAKLDAAKGKYGVGDFVYDVFKTALSNPGTSPLGMVGSFSEQNENVQKLRKSRKVSHSNAYETNEEYRAEVDKLETDLAEVFDKTVGAKKRKLQQQFDKHGYNDLNQNVVQGLASTANFIPFAIATYATKNPKVLETYIGLMGLQSKGLAFSEAIEDGASYSQAMSNSNINGIVESALGRFGFGPNSKFMRSYISENDGAMKQMLKQVPVSVLTELGAENATTLLQETSGLLHGIQTELKIALDNQDNPEYRGPTARELVGEYFQATTIATLVGTGGTITSTGAIKYTGDTLVKMGEAGIKKGSEFLESHNKVVKNVTKSNRVLDRLTLDPLDEASFEEFLNDDSYIDHIARQIIQIEIEHDGPKVKKVKFPKMDKPLRPRQLLQKSIDPNFEEKGELALALGVDKLPLNVLKKGGLRSMDDVILDLQEQGFIPPMEILAPGKPSPDLREEAYKIISRNEPSEFDITRIADFENAFDFAMLRYLNQQTESLNINQIRSKNRLKRDDVEESLSRLEDRGEVFEDNDGFRISRPTDEQVPITMDTIPATLEDTLDVPEISDEVIDFENAIDMGMFNQILSAPKRKKTNKIVDDPDPQNSFELNDLSSFFNFWNNLDRRFANKWTDWNRIFRGVVKEVGFEGVEEQYRAAGLDPDAKSIDIQVQADIFQGPVAETSKVISQEILPKLVKHLDDNNISTEQFDLFLYAQHAIERNKFLLEDNKKELAELQNKVDPLTPRQKRRVVELQEKINKASGSGMTTEKATDILADLGIDVMNDGKMQANSKGGQAYLDGYENFVDPLLEIKRGAYKQAGLVDENQIDDWSQRYRYYVPLKGFAEDTLEIDGQILPAKPSSNTLINSSFTIPKTLEKKARGRESFADAPLTQTINDAIAAKIYAQKNKVALAAGEFALAYPQSELYEVKKANMFDRAYSWGTNGKEPDSAKILFKKDGVSYALKIKREGLAKPFENMDNVAQNIIFRLARPVTRYLSYINTSLDPEFIMNNFIRDVQTGYKNLITERSMEGGRLEALSLEELEAAKGFNAKNIFLNAKRFLKFEARRGSKNPLDRDSYEYRLVKAFKDGGAQTGFLDQKTLQDRAKEVQNLMDIYQGDLKANVKKTFSTVANVIENFNFGVENAVRLTAFEIYINAKGGLDKVTGADLDNAAALAKNLTVNFNRGGTDTGALNATFLFFNASVQGTINVFRGASTKRKQQIFGALASIGSAATIYNVLGSGEDEDGNLYYEKLSDFDKMTGLIFMFPNVSYIDGEITFEKYGISGKGKQYFVVDEKGKKRPIGIKIPLPYGYAFFHNLGRVTTEVALSKSLQNYDRDIPEAGLELASSLVANYSPIGFDNSENKYKAVAKTVVPDAFLGLPTQALTEIAFNEDFFGSPIYYQNFPGQNKPSSWHETNKTYDFFEYATKMVNEFSGGTEFAAGDIDIDPSFLQYTFDYMTGGLGRLVGRTTNLFSEDKPSLNQIPFLRRLAVTTRDVQDTSEFYNNYTDLLMIQSQYRDSFDSADDGDAWLDKNHPWARDIINTESEAMTRRRGNRSALNGIRNKLKDFKEREDEIRNDFYENDKQTYYKEINALRLEQNAYYQSINNFIEEQKKQD